MAVGIAGRYQRTSPVTRRRISSSGVSATTRARVSGLFKEAKALYAPGGEYMKGIEAQLKRGGEKAVTSGMQGLAAAGLAGTSMMGGLGLKYEEDVATPARSQATTARLGALSGILQAEAGATANLATRYSTSPGSYGGSGGGGSSYAPTKAASTQRPTTTAMKLPALSAFPSLTTTRKEPTGYQGVYFGKAFYDKQKTAAAAKAKPKSTGSFYSDFLSRGGTSTGLKGLDPYNISSMF